MTRNTCVSGFWYLTEEYISYFKVRKVQYGRLCSISQYRRNDTYYNQCMKHISKVTDDLLSHDLVQVTQLKMYLINGESESCDQILYEMMVFYAFVHIV